MQMGSVQSKCRENTPVKPGGNRPPPFFTLLVHPGLGTLSPRQTHGRSASEPYSPIHVHTHHGAPFHRASAS